MGLLTRFSPILATYEMVAALAAAARPLGWSLSLTPQGSLLPLGWSFPERAQLSLLAQDGKSVPPGCSARDALAKIHDGLSSQLSEHGFVRSELEEGHNDFVLTEDGQMRPRFYAEEPWCMAGDGPVRPIVFRVSDEAQLKRRLVHATDRVIEALGPSALVDKQPEDAMHASLFHPDTFYAWRKNMTGRANESQTPEQRLPMSRASLAKEMSRIQEVASKAPPFITLEVDRVTMTSGGVLLALLRPPVERQCQEPSEVDALRQQLATAFPHGNGPSRILHVSLLRLLDLPEAELSERADAVRAVCDEVTAALQGFRFNMSRLLVVHEQQIITLRGAWQWATLGRNESAEFLVV